jgi:hypothetical protein
MLYRVLSAQRGRPLAFGLCLGVVVVPLTAGIVAEQAGRSIGRITDADFVRVSNWIWILSDSREVRYPRMSRTLATL